MIIFCTFSVYVYDLIVDTHVVKRDRIIFDALTLKVCNSTEVAPAVVRRHTMTGLNLESRYTNNYYRLGHNSTVILLLNRPYLVQLNY